jgi:hypothetical protein
MSILGSLLAFATGFAAKVKLPADAELNKAMATCKKLLDQRRALEAENAQLKFGVELLQRELMTERSLKLHWREEASRLAVEARERRERQEQQLFGAQLNAAMAQACGQYYQQNQLGAQIQAQRDLAHWQEWDDCTCIPDRASALKRPPG